MAETVLVLLIVNCLSTSVWSWLNTTGRSLKATGALDEPPATSKYGSQNTLKQSAARPLVNVTFSKLYAVSVRTCATSHGRIECNGGLTTLFVQRLPALNLTAVPW